MQHVNVSEDHYTILQDERIQDGFDQTWNRTLCSQILREVILKKGIREVYSFDEKGVSKHPNHIATFRALESLSQYPDLENVSFYSLESGSLLTKYMGPFNLIRKQSKCIYNSKLFLSLNTFRIHQSQITWYRILFTLFSRFSYMNCWKTIVVPLHDNPVPLDVHEWAFSSLPIFPRFVDTHNLTISKEFVCVRFGMRSNAAYQAIHLSSSFFDVDAVLFALISSDLTLSPSSV